MNHKNTIEINGKLYDAKSGALLSSGYASATFHPSPSIDGVVNPRPRSDYKVKKTSYSLKSKANHNPKKRRSAQKSRTLMRQAVKKPGPTKQSKHEIKSFKRTRNSPEVNRSPFVHKFSANHIKPVEINDHIAVESPPKPHLTKNNIITTKEPKLVKEVNKKDSLEDIFKKAIADAPSKRKRSKKNKSRAQKVGRTATLAATFVVLAGFIAYMNFANLQVKIASTQAGFDASLPGYTVAGYKMNRAIDTDPGKVTISFTSNTDDRSYTVNEEASRWNSYALQENYLSARNITYQTTQDAGKTIFLYDNGNATWVNGGVWYTINSDSLSTEQLVNIASSL